MIPVDVLEVERRWRPLAPDERATAGALLDDAWALAQLRVPDVEERLVVDGAATPLLVMVLTGAVLRVLKNPDGKRSEQLEDYRYEVGAGASGVLALTDEDLGLLRATPATASAAFTIRPYGAPDVEPW